MTKTIVWTADKVYLLHELAGTMAVSELAERIGCSTKQAQNKAQRLGVSLVYSNRKHKCWTQDEERYLKRNAGVISGVEMAKQLGLHETQVRRKAVMLGISLRVRGDNHHSATFSNHDIELCRMLADEGVKPCVIAEKMEISSGYLSDVLKHKARAYI